MRFRHTYMLIGSIFVVILFLITDPESKLIENMPFGASTVVMITWLLRTIWCVGILHLSRRALLDYLDLRTLLIKAEQTPEGAGRAMQAVGMIMIAVSIIILGILIGG